MEKKPKKVTGIAWCGAWSDGQLGFNAPIFVEGKTPSSISEEQRRMLEGNGWFPSHLFRVRVTIQLVLNKRGKPTVRRNRNALR